MKQRSVSCHSIFKIKLLGKIQFFRKFYNLFDKRHIQEWLAAIKTNGQFIIFLFRLMVKNKFQ